jgi:hypothetical protein
MAAGGGRRGEEHSVITKLGVASLLSRGYVEVASGPAKAAVATHDKTGGRGGWGSERLGEGRSAGDAAFKNQAGRHVWGLSVWRHGLGGWVGNNTKGISLFKGIEGVAGEKGPTAGREDSGEGEVGERRSRERVVMGARRKAVDRKACIGLFRALW